MKIKITLLFLIINSLILQAQTGIEVPSMKNCDQLVNEFLATYDIPAATFALSKNGKLVYMRGFGNWDLAGIEETQPYHKFRLASVSKPITSIAIMKLMEKGKLKLTDKVFGTGGLLENHPTFSKLTINDTRIFDITVQQLLEHSAGWDRDIDCFPNPMPPYPYWFPGCDPIAIPLHVTQSLGAPNPVTEENLISFLINKGLDHDPGTYFAYSNIGYLVLGEIIEEITGFGYEQYVQDSILAPLGICDMELGKNIPPNHDKREAEYMGNGYVTLSSDGSGELVPWEYGGFNIEAMDAHGGWIATARDLVKLIVAVDGFPTKKDILTSSTINLMVKPSVTLPNYAKGWSVNSANNWWHGGSLDGTSTFIARSATGYTWALLLNKRIIDQTADAFYTDFDALPWKCITSTSSWPTHDLMLFPTNAGDDAYLPKISENSAELSWTPGDGEKRIVVLTENDYISKYPLDGINYDADNNFGSGSDLGDNCFVVYDGSGSSVLIQGLKPGTHYVASIFEYNQNPNTGNNALYQLCNNLQRDFFTAGTNSSTSIAELKYSVSPNPFQDEVRVITNNSINGLCTLDLLDSQGKLLNSRNIFVSGDFDLDMREYEAGLYFIKLTSGEKSGIIKTVKVN